MEKIKRIFKRKEQQPTFTQEDIDRLLDEAADTINETYAIGCRDGFEDGYKKGYNVGRADGIEVAKQAATKAINRRNQHGTKK